MILDTFSSYYRNFVDIIPSWPWPRSLAKWRGYRIAPSTGKITQKDIVENSIVFLNNAQNPMGYVYTNEELYNLQDAAKYKSSMIVHDIAYWDFFDKPYPLLLSDRNFATFTFSKGAGLCGLRIGGLIASKNNMEKFRNNNPARLGVSVLAESVAMASLNSIDEWKPRNLKIIKNNKQRVREEFSDLEGVNFLHDDPVHKLIVTFDDNIDGTEFTNRLKKEGIAVCDMSTRMYDVGIKEPNVNMINFTIAIPDEWLNELINKFKKVYYSYGR